MISATGIAAAISIGYAVAPVYQGDSGHETVIEANGAWVVALLAVPVAIAAAPALIGSHTRSATLWSGGLMVVFALVTGFTIGVPYLLPAAILLAAGPLGESLRTE